MIIGISGKIGSGKDTVATIIQYLTHSGKYDSFQSFLNYSIKENSGWEVKKFAKKLKEIVSILTGIPIEKFEDQEFKKSYLGEEWSYLISDKFYDTIHTKESLEINEIEHLAVPYTVREFLQRVGTNALRDKIHEDVWVNALFSEYKFLDDSKRVSMGNIIDYSNCPFPNWLISDLRFQNEFNAIKIRKGLCIRINRNINNKSNHPSEISLDHIENWDYVLNNNGSIEELIEEVRKMLIYFKILK